MTAIDLDLGGGLITRLGWSQLNNQSPDDEFFGKMLKN
jgi:hypothetical protein